eukprot:Seg984.12 transcript_id=Seg984.12/GoldUCD/mRNA.D3Y31 product="hypothetical protein" protein_id=Seg984.12/GoldUCD/D3Y31
MERNQSENEAREDGDDVAMKRAMNMTVPERIVLSAGYDGDDNDEEESQISKPDLFGDQPLMPPDVLMVGMHTPPSTLTIDHSDATYARQSRSQAGDGSDSSHPQFQTLAMLQNQYDDSQDSDDDESRLSLNERESERMALVGREDERLVVNRQLSFAQLQRRVRMLENELIDTQRSHSIWKIVLVALTVINPILLSYFTRRR